MFFNTRVKDSDSATNITGTKIFTKLFINATSVQLSYSVYYLLVLTEFINILIRNIKGKSRVVYSN